MITAESIERQDRYYALGGTIIISALILLILFLFTIITPIPPFGGGGVPGVLELGLTWGTGDVGQGMSKNDNIGDDNNSSKQASAVTPPDGSNDAVLTSDAEESIQLKDEKKKNHNKPNKKKEKSKKEVVKNEEPKASDELMDAINKMREKNAVTEGGRGENNVEGAAGDPTGTGGGGGGTGGGKGGSEGANHGPNKGPHDQSGFYTSIKQPVRKRPHLVDDSGEEGNIVVDIVVDANGRVKSASPGSRGTTLTNKVLWSKARQAAFETQFAPSEDGVKEQRGTITFVFLRR